MEKHELKLIVAVIGLCLVGDAQAQTIPCYSADQCAQVRIQAQQRQAAQEAANQAQRQANILAQRAAAHAEAEQARQQAAARTQQAILDQAAADQAARDRADYDARARVNAAIAQRQAELDFAAAEARQKQAAQDRADAQASARREIAEAQARAQMDAENRAAAQLAAENSAENHCRDRKIAGELLQTFNAYQAVQDMNLQAVDIEHLTTIKFDKEQHVYVCHGAFVLMNGIHRTGILSTRLNVAGNVISTWHTDPS